MSLNKFLVVTASFLILSAIPVTVFVVSNQRDQRSKAAGDETASSSSATPKVTTTEFDLNQDGRVDVFDLSLISKNWGDKSKPKEDVNQDGDVNALDISELVNHWY